MNKKSFADKISDETFAEMIDITLNLERATKDKNIKINLLKIIPAVAAAVFVIGFVNFMGIETPANLANTNKEITLNENENSDYIVINGERYSTSITHLELDSSQLANADIEPLRYMVNLQSLRMVPMTLTPGENYCLPGNTSDLSALAGLTNLTNLSLYSNQIKDISVLAGLTNLVELNLGNNQISDISAVAELTNLQSLDLAGSQINDINALAGLTNLNVLNLRETYISDISPLAELKNLKILNLFNSRDIYNHNQIKEITTLSRLTNLSILALGGNQINDISALAGLTNLTHLDLCLNQISDISPLAGLKNLAKLDLRENLITDMKQIEKLREVLPNTEILFDSLLQQVTGATANQSKIVDEFIVAASVEYDKITVSMNPLTEGMDENWEAYDLTSEEGNTYLLIVRKSDKDFTALIDSDNKLLAGIIDNGILPKMYE